MYLVSCILYLVAADFLISILRTLDPVSPWAMKKKLPKIWFASLAASLARRQTEITSRDTRGFLCQRDLS